MIKIKGIIWYHAKKKSWYTNTVIYSSNNLGRCCLIQLHKAVKCSSMPITTDPVVPIGLAYRDMTPLMGRGRTTNKGIWDTSGWWQQPWQYSLLYLLPEKISSTFISCPLKYICWEKKIVRSKNTTWKSQT